MKLVDPLRPHGILAFPIGVEEPAGKGVSLTRMISVWRLLDMTEKVKLPVLMAGWPSTLEAAPRVRPVNVVV